jgi:hypothetical protein
METEEDLVGDHYTGGVMDQILARIREGRFVVAEFGRNRGVDRAARISEVQSMCAKARVLRRLRATAPRHWWWM